MLEFAQDLDGFGREGEGGALGEGYEVEDQAGELVGVGGGGGVCDGGGVDLAVQD